MPIEQGEVEGYDVANTSQTRRARRKEHLLVTDYAAFLREYGDVVQRHKIDVPGSSAALYSDIYNKTRGHLAEAKAGGSRGEIRMAIGQLADYARYIRPKPAQAVLLDARPSKDLHDLLRRQHVAAIWRDGDRFMDDSNGQFT